MFLSTIIYKPNTFPRSLHKQHLDTQTFYALVIFICVRDKVIHHPLHTFEKVVGRDNFTGFLSYKSISAKSKLLKLIINNTV